MVFCIDARFSDESKQIEILDRSNDQLTLIECEGTVYVYDVHPSPEDPWKPLPTFNIDNIYVLGTWYVTTRVAVAVAWRRPWGDVL